MPRHSSTAQKQVLAPRPSFLYLARFLSLTTTIFYSQRPLQSYSSRCACFGTTTFCEEWNRKLLSSLESPQVLRHSKINQSHNHLCTNAKFLSSTALHVTALPVPWHNSLSSHKRPQNTMVNPPTEIDLSRPIPEMGNSSKVAFDQKSHSRSTVSPYVLLLQSNGVAATLPNYTRSTHFIIENGPTDI